MESLIHELIREVEGNGYYNDFPQEIAMKKLLEDTGFKEAILNLYK